MVFNKQKNGVWTETIRNGVNQNKEDVIQECCRRKIKGIGNIRTTILVRLKKFENNFTLELNFDSTIIAKNKNIARGYFTGPRSEKFIQLGHQRPQDHDYTILAEAMVLKNKHEDLGLYSYDKHFGFFMDEIRKTTGVEVVYCDSKDSTLL